MARMVRERLVDLLTSMVEAEPASIRGDARFEELGLDSVALVEMLGRLEEVFDLHVPQEDAVHLTTVDAVVRYVGRRL